MKKLSCGEWGGENTCLLFFSSYLSPFSGLAIKEWLNVWLTSWKHASFQFPDKISHPLSFMWEAIPRSSVSIIPPRHLKYLSFSLKSSNHWGSFGFHFYIYTSIYLYMYVCIDRSIYIYLFTQDYIHIHRHTNTHIYFFPFE